MRRLAARSAAWALRPSSRDAAAHVHTAAHARAAASEKSFYMRPLPTQHCTPFQSDAGRAMFAEALAQGHMECFFPLIEQVRVAALMHVPAGKLPRDLRRR